MNKFLVCAAAVVSFAVPTSVLAQEAAFEPAGEVEMALAREIVDNGFPPETRMDAFTGVVDQLLEQMIASNPNLNSTPRVRAVVDRFAVRIRDLSMEVLEGHMEAMMEGMIVGYAESFTEEELRAFHAFVTSPEGYGFLTRSSAISAHPAFAEANQAYMNEYMSRVPELQSELIQELAEAMHSDNSKGN